MAETVQWEGVLTHVDDNGNKQEMFPMIKTDKSLTIDGKAADAAVVGAKMKQLEEKDSFNPIEILLADYNNLSEEEKKANVYVITDASVSDLTGDTVLYTGLREGLGPTVNDAIDAIDVKVEAMENRLVTSDGTLFRFGINENGEYGYIVTDSEGADTLIPFRDLVRDTQATATAADITEGFTAWVNGVLITGTRSAPVARLTGTVRMPDEIYTNGNSYSGNVTFETPFDVIPTVTYTKSVYSANYDSEMQVSISNITRSGFDFKITAKLAEVHGYLGISSFTWVAQV